MDKNKRKKLKKAGWNVGDTQGFLGLSDQEQQYIDIKLSLSQLLQNTRRKSGLTQTELAQRIDSSQSRIAKMEGGEPGVSIDLIIRALLALGVDQGELAESIKEPKRI